MNSIEIKPLSSHDYYILSEMLYEALYVPDPAIILSKDIIKEPQFALYYENFGKRGDNAIGAYEDNKIIGAAWYRFYSEEKKGYGFISDSIPEMSIALYEQYRRWGIGTRLLNYLCEYASNDGLKKISLSVHKENSALKLYLRSGFYIHTEENDSIIMIKNL